MVGKGQKVAGLRGCVLILCLYWTRGIGASDMGKKVSICDQEFIECGILKQRHAFIRFPQSVLPLSPMLELEKLKLLQTTQSLLQRFFFPMNRPVFCVQNLLWHIFLQLLNLWSLELQPSWLKS